MHFHRVQPRDHGSTSSKDWDLTYLNNNNVGITTRMSGWWFETFVIFPFSWECHHPSWLIFFRGLGIPPTSITRIWYEPNRRPQRLETAENHLDFGRKWSVIPMIVTNIHSRTLRKSNVASWFYLEIKYLYITGYPHWITWMPIKSTLDPKHTPHIASFYICVVISRHTAIFVGWSH